MTKEQLKTYLVKEAAAHGYPALTVIQEAYLDGVADKLASAPMIKEAWLQAIPAALTLGRLALGALSAYSGGKAIQSASKGEWGDAALNAFGALPGVGIFGKALGWGGKALGGTGLAGKAIDAGTKMTNWAGSGKVLPSLSGAGWTMTNPVAAATVTGGLTAAPWLYNKMTGGGSGQPQPNHQPQPGYYTQYYQNPTTRMH